MNVAKNFQRIGIGTAALEQILFIADHLKIDQIVAQVEKKEEGVMAFFEKGGYVEEKILEDFLRKGNVGAEMVKKIASPFPQDWKSKPNP